jgi:hypothetical protein
MDVRGGLIDPSLVRGGGESQPNISVILDATLDVVSECLRLDELHRTFLLESLILAQDERWRRA